MNTAGRRLYVCLGPALASALYRGSRDFTINPFSLQVARALSGTDDDLRIWERGSWGKEVPRGTKVLYHGMHHMLPQELTGRALEEIAAMYMKCLRKQIRRQIEEIGGRRVQVDLVHFLKRALTVASSEAMFGSKFLDFWETLYEDYWAFDPQIQTLMFGLPRWMAHKAYRARNQCLSKIKAWEHGAVKAEAVRRVVQLEVTETVWDEY